MAQDKDNPSFQEAWEKLRNSEQSDYSHKLSAERPGNSLSKEDRQRIYEEEKVRQEARESIKSKGPFGGCIAVVILLLVVLWFVGKYGCLDGSSTNPSPRPSVTVSAYQLWGAYDANEIAADQQYKGRTITVTGFVDNIGKDVVGSPYVTLKTGNMFNSIQCVFDRTQEDYLARLSQDQMILIQGICKGTTLGNVILDDCILKH